MPVAKKTISLQPATVEAMQARDEELSGAIQKSLDRYLEVLRWGRADLRDILSEAELSLVLDVLNGTGFMDLSGPAFIPHEVADGIRLDQLDEKWNVDGRALVKKLDRLTYAQRCALADAAERWWMRIGRGENPEVSEALK